MRVLDDWLLTPARAAIHVPTATAVVADLHLGYDRIRRRSGDAVPVRRVADELAALGAELGKQKVSRLVIAGDLFEDGRYQRDEVLRELRQDLCDADAAEDYARSLPRITLRVRKLSCPSPFAETWSQREPVSGGEVISPADALARLHAELIGGVDAGA